MIQKHDRTSLFRFALILFMLSIAQTGCDQTQTSKLNSESDSGSLPKLKFHQPKGYSDAVVRLQEINRSIVDDGPLPSPLKFTVLEIIHGEGSGAHSHYYLASEQGADEDHGHEGMTSREKTYDIEIDIFTEFVDIVRWLPFIAADGDMPESPWIKVNSISEKFEECLKTALNGGENDEAKRDAIKKKRETIEDFLKQLEAHSPAHSSENVGGR